MFSVRKLAVAVADNDLHQQEGDCSQQDCDASCDDSSQDIRRGARCTQGHGGSRESGEVLGGPFPYLHAMMCDMIIMIGELLFSE